MRINRLRKLVTSVKTETCNSIISQTILLFIRPSYPVPKTFPLKFSLCAERQRLTNQRLKPIKVTDVQSCSASIRLIKSPEHIDVRLPLLSLQGSLQRRIIYLCSPARFYQYVAFYLFFKSYGIRIFTIRYIQ